MHTAVLNTDPTLALQKWSHAPWKPSIEGCVHFTQSFQIVAVVRNSSSCFPSVGDNEWQITCILQEMSAMLYIDVTVPWIPLPWQQLACLYSQLWVNQNQWSLGVELNPEPRLGLPVCVKPRVQLIHNPSTWELPPPRGWQADSHLRQNLAFPLS